MNKKVGFIGCGNMGKAMLTGLLSSNYIKKENIIASTFTRESAEMIAQQYKISTTLNNAEVVSFSDIIIVAVRPSEYEKVLKEIATLVTEEKVIVTIAAGVTLGTMQNWFHGNVKIIKTMPNTPVYVQEGISAICPNDNITDNELREICGIFSQFGTYEILNEDDFHAFIALCGSSPAYVFVMIEAMADAAVKLGLPRKTAYKMAEQSIVGSAKLALMTGEHPAMLKDMVCSPSGTTIEAVLELEKQGFRNSIASAMEICANKSKALQNNIK